MTDIRVGIGYDVHPLVEGRRLVLGGVPIGFTKGLKGHSDADVLVHAIIDALIGAMGEGDIGIHFPSSKQDLKDISSLVLLRETHGLLKRNGFVILNIDSTIVAQAPRLVGKLPEMKSAIARVLETEEWRINIKAKSPEGLGFCGKEEGMEAFAVALLKKE